MKLNVKVEKSNFHESLYVDVCEIRLLQRVIIIKIFYCWQISK